MPCPQLVPGTHRAGARAVAMPLQPGTSLGPYQIDAPLGAGGMGEVYRATDTRLDRDVALKDLQVSPSRHSVTVAVTPGPARRQV